MPSSAKLDSELERFLKGDVLPYVQRSKIVTGTFTTANADTSVRHRLGYIPTYYRILSIDKAAIIYRDPASPKWTESVAWLKSDTSSVTVSIEFF